MEREVDISIPVLTYYHEKYIAQALDSILMQKTDLRYEIIVADDASGDRTPEIIREYAEKYPDKITPILREKNLGASRNSCEMMPLVRGKYIASLEGDDYWLDPYKLQKQWDFLENHSEYVGCGSKCLIVDEHGVPNYAKTPMFANTKKVFTMEDFERTWSAPAQAGTLMYRNIYRDMKPSDYAVFYEAHPTIGDKTNMLFLLSRGPIYCFNETFSAYRFVVKKDGHNWYSMYFGNPDWQYDGFIYPRRLESWAKKELGLKLHLGARNVPYFCGYVEKCAKEPSIKRLKNLTEMLVHSHDPIKYSAYIVKALVEMER